MLYEYNARDRAGKPVNGSMMAASVDEVASQLLERNVTPIKIFRKKASHEEDVLKDIKRWLNRRPVEIEELIIFSKQMYSLSKAGIPITKAIRGLSGTFKSQMLRESLDEIAISLESGMELAEAMKAHSFVFPEIFINIIRIGENTGDLDGSFLELSKYLELERETQKRVKAAFRYPTIVISAVAIAMGVINLWVIPAFAKVFSSFGAELPWATRILVTTSEFFISNWLLLLIVGIGTFFATRFYLKTPEGRLAWDQYKLKVPIIGKIILLITVGRFCRSFAMMVNAGLPVLQSLTVIAVTTENRYLGEKIHQMKVSIEKGESITRSARGTHIFTDLVLQMFSVGEETGQLGDLMAEIADYYEREVDYDLKRLSESIEPIVLAIMGVMVLVLALGVFLPMWDLSSVAIKR